jgi:hypothetical protein
MLSLNLDSFFFWRQSTSDGLYSQSGMFLRTGQTPEPDIVTCVPVTPEVGVTLVIVGVTTVKFTLFDHTPPCRIAAVPVFDPEATVATTCASLQLTTTP